MYIFYFKKILIFKLGMYYFKSEHFTIVIVMFIYLRYIYPKTYTNKVLYNLKNINILLCTLCISKYF